MGQGVSSHPGGDESSSRQSRPFSQLWGERWRETRQQEGQTETSRIYTTQSRRERILRTARARGSHREEGQSTLPSATFRRQISTQSTPATDGVEEQGRGSTTRDEVYFEQEERPLVNLEDLRMQDAPITHVTPSPMPRPPSMISRLGSRLLPRYAATGSAISTEDGTGESRILRRELSDNSPDDSAEAPRVNRHRFSLFSSPSLESSTSNESATRRDLATISRPIPLLADGSVPPSGLPANHFTRVVSDAPVPLPRRTEPNLISRSLRSSRLARVRRSISSFESLFASNSNQSNHERQNQTPPRRPVRLPTADETDYLLPPLAMTNTSIDLEDSRSANNADLMQPRHNPFTSEMPVSPDPSPSWAQRWAERSPTVRREARRVPNLLRGRSSRLIRRDDEAPLSRILQLAAAAIAAQLSGTPDGVTDMETLGDDTLDGSLATFLDTMHSATGTTTAGAEAHRTLTTIPPLNLLRVFRFVNSNPENRRGSSTASRAAQYGSSAASEASVSNDAEEVNDGRTVTLVVVGVRSVPSASLNREDTETNLDALLSLPLRPPAATRNTTSANLLRHASGTSRLAHRRRASMGGVNQFPANYDSQRHQRMQSSSRSASGDTTPVTTAAIPMILSETPAGPNAPPSTPADPYLSAQPSGTNTPNRRPSSASAAQQSQGPYHDNLLGNLGESRSSSSAPHDPHHAVRQRRRSDSEFARHRDLGAGAARRNGVVEPDDAPSQGRTWLIYVVGTNLSEDHPAFATPSLFTDVSFMSHHCEKHSR